MDPMVDDAIRTTDPIGVLCRKQFFQGELTHEKTTALTISHFKENPCNYNPFTAT